MSKQISKLLTICIFGKNCVSILHDCIKHATELTDGIFFVDLGSDDQSKSKARELGAKVVDLDSFTSYLKSKWVLFIKPEEKAVLRSRKDLCGILSNQSLNGYSVMTQRYIEPSALAGFQWVSSLEQYKNMKHYIHVPMLEIRLVRRPYADKCLNMLVQDVIPNDFHLETKAQDVIFLNSNQSKQVNILSDDDDHDLRCLKGDLTYEVGPHDALFELSKDYIQYGVLNKGFLSSFIEGAKLGFGGDKMYLNMINYLVQFGHFDDAKDFYETWCRNRSEKESLDLLSTGGLIYSNLLLIDQGITCYQKSVQINQCADLFANLGKLYLLKGDRDKTLFYFKKAVDIKPDPLYCRIIEIVEKRDWKPSKLSLCMIARDEEEYILRCLKSIENIADEIIVVDTGSSDATVQIVKEFGGKVILASWNDDFSSMRNIGLKEATGDYILCMDADEFIEPRQRLPLSIFKAMLPPKKDLAFQVMVESEDKEEEMSVMLRVPSWNKILYHLRLFPNRPEIRFQGPAFEEVSKSLRELRIKTATDDIFKISHGIAKTKLRAERKIEAVKKSFENIHNPEYFFQGALLFLGLGELPKSCGKYCFALSKRR
jgi:glycosyltransferase involved in cell wall biosynthesis